MNMSQAHRTTSSMEPHTTDDAPIPQGHDCKQQPAVHLSENLRKKLEGLSKWRIDSSRIQFSKDAKWFQGGFATVSRASLVGIARTEGSAPGSRDVAVKQLKIKSPSERAKVLGLALREARFLVELFNDCIVTLEGFVEDISNDQIWLVLSWAENGNLGDFIARAEWQVPERISLINDLAGALEYLHTRNPPIHHGDLKSVNILVNSERRAVLTDFGSARRVGSREVETDDTPVSTYGFDGAARVLEAAVDECANTITLTGNKFTLRWAAPEVITGDDAGTEADIWSFGWVCYEVMTGHIPFPDNTKATAITLRIFRGDLPLLDAEARISLIRKLGSLMLSCWSMTSEQRPTASQCVKLLGYMPTCVPRSPQSLGAGSVDAVLYTGLGRMYQARSEYEQALNAFSKALEAAKMATDVRVEADALCWLASVHGLLSDHAKAVSLYEACLRICEDTGDRSRKVRALVGLANIHAMQSAYATAVPLYEECLRSYEETGVRNGKAAALWGLANIHRMQSAHAKAVPLYEECLQIRDDTGDRHGKALALFGLAETYRMQGNYMEAVLLYEECLQIREDMGDRIGRASALHGLAELHRMQSKHATAFPLYEESIQIALQINFRHGAAYGMIGLGHIYSERDEPTNAINNYESAADLLLQIGRTSEAAEASAYADKVRKKVTPDSNV